MDKWPCACRVAVLLWWAFAASAAVFAQQVPIARIESMPAFPSPYEMRDWKAVARAYDDYVFDLERTGQYLPLAWVYNETVNYPGQPSFGLRTYVGTVHTRSSETINVLPALVGATLVGVDKRTHLGRDWVAMAREYFNNRPEEAVYLNSPTATSGSDFWYDTMPNVFFYQLYDLYGEVGEFPVQFVSVADRWLEAVAKMGGSATPWALPEMNIRGWKLSTMTPTIGTWVEPEAAGALAWILYMAYDQTGEERYRVGAEWAMEYLSGLTTNPSYELQLDYGVVAAARMNAELGTAYDLEKLFRWCFDMGPLRQWGTIVGRWGPYDVSGLVGEARGFDDYAFAMNTFQRVAALAPVARYDDRFARAIGRYVLNAANAARLFYRAYLPDSLQDYEGWSRLHDPESLLAHEAIKQFAQSKTPYATGDAVGGGWAYTNFAVYGSSHVGYLGAVVDTTEVPGLLRLDLTATDFFSEAYPTYLLYNPHDTPKSVSIPAGATPSDVYELTSDRFVAEGVSGDVLVDVPADGAVLVAVVPAGGQRVFDGERLLVDGKVVDFRARTDAGNRLPRIKALAAEHAEVGPGGATRLHCTAVDPDGSIASYRWEADAGVLAPEGAEAVWTAPEGEGSYGVRCLVEDEAGAEASAEINLVVAPATVVVEAVTAEPVMVELGGHSLVTCQADVPAGVTPVWSWEASDGDIVGEGAEVVWMAPVEEGSYTIRCHVAVVGGPEAEGSVEVLVRDFNAGDDARLLLYLPLDGDAVDAGPFSRTTRLTGAVPASDFHGRAASALRFDGLDDFVSVANATDLNFEGGITVSFWMRIDKFTGREAFVASHGSWETRWKLSLADDRLRWTVKTDRSIRDVDTGPLVAGRFYHVVARYDGRDFNVYLDGALAAHAAHEGRIQAATVDLTLAQRLPTDKQYNFAGVLDEFRLYEGALPIRDVLGLYAAATPVEEMPVPEGQDLTIDRFFPNPFRESARLQFQTGERGRVAVEVFDMLGSRVATLAVGVKSEGRLEVAWDGRDDAGRPVAPGVYVVRIVREGMAPVVRMVVYVGV